MINIHTDEPSTITEPSDLSIANENTLEQEVKRPYKRKIFTGLLAFVLTFTLGLGSGYAIWEVGLLQKDASQTRDELINQINPDDGYSLQVTFENLGPALLSAGAIDFDKFVQVYDRAGRPLTEAQRGILENGSNAEIIFDRENAYFLLNFFWALGLTNQNVILTEGPMMQYGPEQVGRFASTGGWTIGTKPATELYASVPLLTLTSEQQARLESVAQNVYRPCCNNPTHFPDCNHGMAMLGMLTLLASEGASEAEMYEAAKYANAFWYPQQTYELALYFDAIEGLSFADVDAARLVSRDYSSGAGFGQVHEYLAANGLLQQAPGGGNSCGV